MSNTRYSVLITDAGLKHTLGIVRNLGKKDISVHIIASKPSDISIYSKYCDKYTILDELNIDVVKTYLRKHKIDLIIPVGSDSMRFFVENSEYFNEEQLQFAPSKNQLDLTFSKKKTYEFAIKFGIQTPKTFYPSEKEDIQICNNKLKFPVVIKWLYESGDSIVDYANNMNDLTYKYWDICERYGFNKETGYPMIQEYINGIGVGYFALYKCGKKICSYQHERLREGPASGGASVAARTIYDQELEENGSKLLDELNWNGVAMVEFKRKTSGQFVLMEINPKFWGSHDLGLAAGLSCPFNMVLFCQNRSQEIIDKYKVGMVYHWPLNGDFRYAFTSIKRLVSVIYDTININVKNNLCIFDDIKPDIMMIVNLFQSLIRKIIPRLGG